MNKVKAVSIFIIVVTTFSTLKAQNLGSDYTTAVGLKFYPTSITVKHFLQEDRAIEGLIYLWEDGYRFTGLYEFHGDINGVEGLKWYAGFGGHIGAYGKQWKIDNPNKNQNTTIGVDGVLGLDFKFTDVPINLSADWQPSYNFTGYNYLEAGWAGLSVRYTF